jgi:hypothetical protein
MDISPIVRYSDFCILLMEKNMHPQFLNSSTGQVSFQQRKLIDHGIKL